MKLLIYPSKFKNIGYVSFLLFFFSFSILDCVSAKNYNFWSELKNISNTKAQYVESKNKSIYVVFAKDCKACAKMMVESKCFKAEGIEVYFVGIIDKAVDLISYARKSGYKQDIYSSEQDIVERNGISVTPTVFLLSHGILLKRFDGYLSCKEIKSLFKSV